MAAAPSQNTSALIFKGPGCAAVTMFSKNVNSLQYDRLIPQKWENTPSFVLPVHSSGNVHKGLVPPPLGLGLGNSPSGKLQQDKALTGSLNKELQIVNLLFVFNLAMLLHQSLSWNMNI